MLSESLFSLALRRAALCPLVLVGGLLAGCQSAPVPVAAPEVAVPGQFAEASLFQPANLSAAEVPDAWWTLFNDPVLDALQAQLVADNLNLQSARAAVVVAQATLDSSRATLWPQVNLGLGATRSVSVTSGASGASGSGGAVAGAATNSYSAQASLSTWEVDLWNRLGAGVDAAQAKLQASRYTLAATRLSLQATLAQTYFSARAAQGLVEVLTRSQSAYEQSLALVRARYEGGVTSVADVAQAQAQLQSVTAQLAEARLQRAQLEHALALLVGQAPAAFTLAPVALPGMGTGTATPADWLSPLPQAPQPPALLPSRLLERRPDIAAAAQQVAAANAQVGAARSAFFPVLALSANVGVRNPAWHDLFQAANRFWSFGPSVALSVFDAGARAAARDSAEATHTQAVAAYRQTVLTALQEVEDNLAATARLGEALAAQQAALTASRKALDVAQHQYKAGTVGYLNVLTAQTSVLSAERAVLDASNRRLAAINQLLKNTAGRWE